MKGAPLVIGIGEIGKPLYEIIKGVYPRAEWADIGPREIGKEISVMHICFSYNEKFVDTVVDYIKQFQPKLTIIESTVPPFTTQKIYRKNQKPICHSPVRGRKADGFKWGLFTYTKFIGPTTDESGKMADEYYRSLGFKTRICKSSLETEFMKIINTTYYGLMIAWFQEVNRICKKFSLNKEDITEFIGSTERESGGKISRPVFYPGYIGGHCLIPNALLLNNVYPSSFIKALLDSNEKTAASE